jgi:hypothetical protein
MVHLSSVKLLPERHQIDKMDHMVYNNINMTSALSQMFKKFSILAHAQDGKDYKNQQLDPLVDKSLIHGQILNDVKYIWTRVTGINLTLYQGVKMIEKINFRDSYLALNCEKVIKEVRFINRHYFIGSRDSIANLVQDLSTRGIMHNTQKQTTLNPPTTTSTSTSAAATPLNTIVNNIISYISQQSNQLKYDIVDSSLILQKYKEKQKPKTVIDLRIDYLDEFTPGVLFFAMLNCVWSSDYRTPAACKGTSSKLHAYQNQMDEMIATLHEDTYSYFTGYSGTLMKDIYTRKGIVFDPIGNSDNKREELQQLVYQQPNISTDKVLYNHLLEEYIWYQSFHTTLKKAKRILAFACKIQKQRVSTTASFLVLLLFGIR